MKFLLGSLISLLLALGPNLGPSEAAQASSCRNRGPGDKTFSLGSQVDGRLFTVCADQSAVIKFKNNGKPGKPVKLNPKANPTGQVIFTFRRVGSGTRVLFRPVTPKAWLKTKGALQVGQPADFAIDEKVKLGANYILGRKIGVRFTPVKIAVAFSDGATADSFILSHAFAASGTYLLNSLVTYRVEYRRLIPGEVVNRPHASWVLDPGQITLASNSVQVTVGKSSWQNVVLVSQ